MKSQVKTISFFFRPGNRKALFWEQKIKHWLKDNFPAIKIVSKNPEAIIVLGGDGTILDAARKFQKPVILGLNLGQVGFLASVREPRQFLKALQHFFSGRYHLVKKMMIEAEVIRRGRVVYAANAFNEVVVQNPLGIVELDVAVEKDLIQQIRGTGVLVATASGSTAYNLSSHGPIVMPDIKCLIITEILDHNLPTPGVVVKHSKEVVLKVTGFRSRGLLKMASTGEPADVVLVIDGDQIFSLQEKDQVIIKRSSRLVKFAELEKNYFFKSLREKFSFQ